MTGQSPYEISWDRDLTYVSSGALALGLGAIVKARVTLFTPSELERLNYEVLPEIDEVAVQYTSVRARKTSDVILNASIALPLVLLSAKSPRNHFGQIALMYSETVLLNTGLTNLTKYLVQRPRPYVYNAETPVSRIQTIRAQTSFVSGHTSTTASSTFFMARVFSDCYPDSPWKPVVWSAAAVAPAVMGYLRVRAGKHYPTDVIGGYILGASVGYLVPYLHKTHRSESDQSLVIFPTPHGMSLSWQF